MSWVKSAQALQTADKGMEEVVKALAQATVTQQQASAESNRRHEEAMAQQQQALAQAIAAQQENTRLLSAQFTAQQESTQAQVAALQEAVQQLAQGQAQAVVAVSNPVSVRASHFLQKLTPSDDVEAFLTTFERIAEREAWPRDQWAGIISPFLTCDPQKAYFDLPAEHIKDYERLKAEILARLGVTTAVRAQRVHRWRYKSDQPPRSQMHELIQLVKKWLQPEKLSGPQMVERVVMDRYLRSLQDDLQRWVSHGNPTNADQLIELVERYTVVEDLLGPAKRREPTPRTPRPATNLRREALPDVGVRRFTPSALEPRRSVPVPKMGDIQCWRCRSWGHTRAQCPLQEEPMECGTGRRSSFYVRSVCTTHLDLAAGRFECEVWVNHLPARALLDSGSMVTLVHARVLGRLRPVTKTLRVVCIHGDTKEYPLVPVTVSYGHASVTQEVGVVNSLIHDIIVGRDCPLFLELWNEVQMAPPGELGALGLEGTGSEGSGAEIHPSDIEIPTIDNEVAGNANVEDNAPDPGLKPGLISEGGEVFPLQVMLGEDDEELSPVEEDEGETSSRPVHPDLDVSRGAFGTAQLRDPALVNAREQVSVVDGVPQMPDADQRFPHFALKGDLLYRVAESRGETIEQLLVPQPYRRMLLDLAHNDALGGHLGAEKTEARINDRFYWPGLKAEVKRYCASCPICQLTAPVPHYRNPLVPLPIIEVPFERIAMDLVGPLVKSARGHQYILVILDYATRYPEAVPLRKASSKAIARELFQMFSRTGFPKEILTDQGTPFMSKVMADLCKLFQIKQLRTSVYHPQTDGLVERFNKTLKSMLKRVVQKDGKDWDMLLPALLFAIREVPQASTGFSPFELLYGRGVCGPHHTKRW